MYVCMYVCTVCTYVHLHVHTYVHNRLIRPNRVKKCFWSFCLVNFSHSDNTQTVRQAVTKRHFMCIHTVVLINTHKNFENVYNKRYKA